MPDIWMDVDVAIAEAPVNVMPLLDDTDFKTREASVAYNAAGMDLVWNFVTTAGAYTQTAVTPTTAGDYDWTNQGDGMYTIEIPASGGASINNDTEGFGWFSGVATGVLPWRGPTIGFRAAGLNNKLIDDAYSATVGLSGTNLDAAITSRLAPTTSGRTLDVTTGGAAGIDWANVENPTTVVGLTGTTTLQVNQFGTQAKADVNAEADTALADIHLDHMLASADPGGVVANNSFWAKSHSKSATAAYSSYDHTTDSKEATRDALSTVSTTVNTINTTTSSTNTIVDDLYAITTTIATVTSQTVFTLTVGDSNNDAYNGFLCVIEGTGVGKEYVSDYVGGTLQVTLRAATEITIQAGDEVKIYRQAFNIATIEADTDAVEQRLTSARAGYIDNLNGHTAQTGDSFARLGAPAGASVSADVAAVKAETALIVADTGTDGVAISTATLQAAADEILKRNVSNVEGTAAEHTLATIVLSILESARTGTTWTIKRTDGTTTHATKTLTVDASANPVTGVS